MLKGHKATPHEMKEERCTYRNHFGFFEEKVASIRAEKSINSERIHLNSRIFLETDQPNEENRTINSMNFV